MTNAPADPSITLGLFRHGQTDWNIDFRLQGTTDIAMNETGVQQVFRASEVLKAQGWDLILTSPLGRAKHTAELLSEALGLDAATVSDQLTERSFGVAEGLTYEQWQQQYEGIDFIPGAEREIEVQGRARLLLDWISREYSGAKVLAVSHGALIRFVLDEVSGGTIPPAGERLQNASLHELQMIEQGWHLKGWSPLSLGAV